MSLVSVAEGQTPHNRITQLNSEFPNDGLSSVKRDEAEESLLQGPLDSRQPTRTILVSGTELVQNGGFESGPSVGSFNFAGIGTPWNWAHTGSSSTSEPRYYSSSSSHTGNWSIYFDWGSGVEDQLSQRLTIPANSTATLSFWLKIRPNSLYSSSESDVFGVNFCDLAGNSLNGFVKNYHLSNGTGSYNYYSYDVSMFAGQSVYLLFWNEMVSNTVFYLDDVSLVVNSANTGACTEDARTMCLVNGRYRVTSYWQNQYAGGALSNLSKTRLTDVTGAFWLADANTYEYLIRINTATNNGRAWIAISTFTDVEFFIVVTDTKTGQSSQYHSAAGNRTLIYDPNTFPYP